MGRPLLDDQLAHPTVQGIAGGDLDPRVFRSWIEQDYLFLLDYVRVFCRLAWQAPDAHVGDLVDLAHATQHEELELHRSLAVDFAADLSGATKGPACEAYTSFLLDAATDYGVGLAALLPCMWGYSELGRSMAAAGLPAEPRYRRWIQTYADPEFAGLAAWCAALLDRAADGLPVARLAACERAFLTSLRHELAFWDV
jgi:thiaminase/transcriptional activator TenA